MNPNSKLWLCKTNLENDYKNTLTFASKNAQRNYFIGNPEDPTSYGVSTKMYTDFTYLRIENSIKVDDFIENIDTNNYAVILNNNKYYYYFITSMDYIDETTTKINIELDVMQTYYFDINYTNTFIEREHVSDDTAGKHTIPEKLETGEYICNDKLLLNDTSDTNIVFQVIYDNSFPNLQYQYGGVFSGTCFLIFDIENGIKYIKALDEAGHRDYIVAIFMYKGNIKSSDSYTIQTASFGTLTYKIVTPTSIATLENFIILNSKPTSNGTYTPRNKKLLCYPYQYLLADNGVGGVKPYKYEDFGQDGVTFARYSTTTIGGSVYYAPRNYKFTDVTESGVNLSEGFAGAKFPVCSWTTDSYTNWLTQNSINEKYNTMGRVGQTLAGATMMAVGGASLNPTMFLAGTSMLGQGIGGAIGDVTEQMKQKEEQQISPIELSGNASLGDVMYALNRSLPMFYKMCIKPEYCRIIDKYFDMFGYQVNELKSPNINSRRYWNYLKTRNCNFTGNIPQEYMDRIKTIFNNGITFWHDPSKMFDYSQSNTIVSNS